MKNQNNNQEMTPVTVEELEKKLEEAGKQKEVWQKAERSLRSQIGTLKGTNESRKKNPAKKRLAEEATDAVTETPAETEEEATAEEAETPAETEEEATEEVTETPVEDDNDGVVVIIPDDEEVTEEETEEVAEKENSKKKKSKSIIWKILTAIFGVAAVLMLIILLSRNTQQLGTGDQSSDNQQPGVSTEQPSNTEQPGTTEQPGSTEQPGTNEQPSEPVEVFDMNSFKNSVISIAETLTDDGDISANVDILVEDIGEDKLKELIEKYDEVKVKKAIAEMLVFVPEVKMQQYIVQNGLDYNPNAAVDYSTQKKALNEAYIAATGKNPDGALMSLPGYDSFKGNRDALRALIAESGDADLLTWYNAKMEIYDTMLKQSEDTAAAEEYKKSIKAEMLANTNGTVKLLELQLEKEAAGQITVIDNVSGQYTESYYKFVLDNYIYVIAI